MAYQSANRYADDAYWQFRNEARGIYGADAPSLPPYPTTTPDAEPEPQLSLF